MNDTPQWGHHPTRPAMVFPRRRAGNVHCCRLSTTLAVFLPIFGHFPGFLPTDLIKFVTDLVNIAALLVDSVTSLVAFVALQIAFATSLVAFVALQVAFVTSLVAFAALQVAFVASLVAFAALQVDSAASLVAFAALFIASVDPTAASGQNAGIAGRKAADSVNASIMSATDCVNEANASVGSAADDDNKFVRRDRR